MQTRKQLKAQEDIDEYDRTHNIPTDANNPQLQMGPILSRTPITSSARKKPKPNTLLVNPPSEDNLNHIQGTLDSGADCSTIPEDIAANLPYDIYVHQEEKYMEYGNGETLSTNQEMKIGDYPVCIMPTEAAQTLISVGEVVDGGHNVLFADEYVRISDKGGKYQVTYDREPQRKGKFARPWRIPLVVLVELTRERMKHYPVVDIEANNDENDDTNEQAHRNSSTNSSSSSSSSGTTCAPSRRKRDRPTSGTEEVKTYASQVCESDNATPIESPLPSSSIQRRATRFAPLNLDLLSQPRLVPSSTGSALVLASPYNDEIVYSDDDESNFNFMTFSARLRRVPKSSKANVMRLHHRMAHAPEEVMCMAVKGSTPLWRNTGVEPWEIRRVFRRTQCLACVLAKRKREGPRKWILNQKEKQKNVTFKNNDTQTIGELLDSDDEVKDKREGKWTTGQCISIDDIGPISPASPEGYTGFYYIKDLASRKVFTHLVSSCSSETYLDVLDRIRLYFKGEGYKLEVVRSDYKNIYKTPSVKAYIEEHNIERQSSSPYHHWQNAVEREVQTMVNNVSANIHGQILLRADTWALALEYYVKVHNALPNLYTGTSPNNMIDGSHTNALYQFKYTFGELVCYGVPKDQRTWKFDVKNDIAFYVGDEPGVKGSYRLFRPYEHELMVRADTAALNISEIQLMAWHGKRREVQEEKLPYHVVKEACIDLLSDHPSTVSGQMPDEIQEVTETQEGTETPLRSSIDVDQEPSKRSKRRKKEKGSINTRNLRPPKEPHYAPRYLNPVTRLPSPKPIKLKLGDPMTWEQRLNTDNDDIELKPPGWDEDMRAQINAMSTFYQEEIHKPTVDADDLAEEIETRDALRAPDRDKFVDAIRKEIFALINDTKTLVPVTVAEYMKRVHHKIGMSLKCKRKKKGSGVPDKHKARGAARGDILAAIYKKSGITPPESYSPTVSAITFALMLQLAVNKGLIMLTTDITAAYLQVTYPEDADWLILKIEKDIAILCDLDPAQDYRIGKYLYGLPDSGRAFFKHYSKALKTEGYEQSLSDPCLFYHLTAEEETYIVIHVDDTFIFTNKKEYATGFVTNMNKHYEVTADNKADSFLGLNLEHKANGEVKLTQPKLLKKLFNEFPVRPTSRKAKKPIHPYSSITINDEPNEQKVQHIEVKKYMRLLGILMYLCKSRPDILAATSFGATKSKSPTVADFNDLYCIVEYLRATEHLGHIIRKSSNGQLLQLYCEVDASYLLHEDSKGHTGYTIAFNAIGTWYNRSSKQTLVTTSSTHAEMRAIFTLIKDILYIFAICDEIEVNIARPAIIMEDNAAVITIAQKESSYLKKCKHFLMIINFVREQVSIGNIEIKKIQGTENLADIHTKRVRSKDFQTKALLMLGKESN